MSCRHCVREVTRWLRDVPGVGTVVASSEACEVVLVGTMSSDAVLEALRGSGYDVTILSSSPA